MMKLMRVLEERSGALKNYSLYPAKGERSDRPLRPIHTMVDEILKGQSLQFNKIYAKVGPEQLLRAPRAATGGRVGLQHIVPLVCGTEFG